MSGPILAWYGDNSTGAAAVTEVLEFGGVPSALLLDPSAPVDLAAFPEAQVIGIVGGDGDEPGGGQSVDRRDAGQCDHRADGGRGIGHSVIAGGDSSGYATPELGPQALTALTETVTAPAIYDPMDGS
jgi:hypothetical protein